MSRIIDTIDPFIGTDGNGSCLVGPYLPNSLVRLGPDNAPPNSMTGYSSKRPILRFSHTHVSGTGGQGRYGNIAFTPFLGDITSFVAPSETAGETAGVGYYSARLVPQDILVELTSTPRCGVHRYRFPGNDLHARIMIDLGAVVQATSSAGKFCAHSTGGFVEAAGDHEIIGRGDYKGGWGHDFPYSVFFYAHFDVAPGWHSVVSGQTLTHGKRIDGPDSKMIACFDAGVTVTARVGISYVSVANARAHAEREALGVSFGEVRARAERVWEEKLSRVRVSGGDTERTAVFNTALYHLYCMPSDLGVDDENPFWKSGARHFTDFYCLWDSVRNANSLLTLIDPDLERDFCNCLIDVADHTGWLPDAWIAGHSAMVQGGSSADILLWEARLKGIAGIDYQKALMHMRRNAEVESPDPWLYGRHLREYRERGYLSTNIRSCVSKTIEYSYQDWCIGQLAGAMGHADVSVQYMADSRKFQTLWRDDKKAFCPCKPDGSWVDPYEPAQQTVGNYYPGDTYHYEGTAWEWSLCALHDLAGVVRRYGGAEEFINHLDRFFSTHLAMWKEIVLHTPYLYHYAGRPDKSSLQARTFLYDKYKATRHGLPDNEDMGSHSAYVICASMGLYPIAGQDLYLLSAPVFEECAIRMNGGCDLVIRAPGASVQRQYITGAKINGVELGRSWVRHGEIAGGGVLELAVSKQAGGWGTTELPPSPLG